MRTLTWNMTDALISAESFSILSGAGLIDASTSAPVYVHTTSQVEIKTANKIILKGANVAWDGFTDKEDPNYKKNAGIFVMRLYDGEINDEPCIPTSDANGGVKYGTYNEDTHVFTETSTNPTHTQITCYYHNGTDETESSLAVGDIVLVDYYVKKTEGVQQIEITPDQFVGYFYVEASGLFRRESDGKDLPAEFVIPRAKVQSNFTFSMAPTGDPSEQFDALGWLAIA